MRASARLAARGTDLERLEGDDQSHEVAAEYRRELTLYLKRLRKNTGAMLRYLLVQEQHKSGLPHFHALIHEVNPLTPLRHAALTSQWKLGYTKFKLCEGPRTAWYVAKYLAKAVDNRVRASLRYGLGDALKHSEQSENVTHPAPPNAQRYGVNPSCSPIAEEGKSCEAVAEFTTPEEKLNALRWLLQRRQGRKTAFETPAEPPLQAASAASQSAQSHEQAQAKAAAQAFLEAVDPTGRKRSWDRRSHYSASNRRRSATFNPVPEVVPSNRL